MRDPTGLDLVVALLGTLGALLLLVAAFAAAAQGNHPTTDRLIVRLADWAGGDPAPTPAASMPPAPSASTTMAVPAAAAVESAGGGGGGCTVAPDGAPEVALPLALLWALAMTARRLLARRRHERAVRLATVA